MNKENMRFLLFLVVTVLVSSLVSVGAASINSADVSYSNTTSGMSASDVDAAVDELYEAANEFVTFKNDVNKLKSFFGNNTTSPVTITASSMVSIVNNGVSRNANFFMEDTGWTRVYLDPHGSVTTDPNSNFSEYNSNDLYALRYRKKGNIVEVKGSFKNQTSGTSSNTLVNVFQLPSGYRPFKEVYFISKSEGLTNYMITISTNGYVKISRVVSGSSFFSYTTDTWYSMDVMFRAS